MLHPNLETKGRLIRGGGAVALGVAAILLRPQSVAAAVLLGGAAMFVAFEAARGWCVLRACGVRTKF